MERVFYNNKETILRRGQIIMRPNVSIFPQMVTFMDAVAATISCDADELNDPLLGSVARPLIKDEPIIYGDPQKNVPDQLSEKFVEFAEKGVWQRRGSEVVNLLKAEENKEVIVAL